MFAVFHRFQESEQEGRTCRYSRVIVASRKEGTKDGGLLLYMWPLRICIYLYFLTTLRWDLLTKLCSK